MLSRGLVLFSGKNREKCIYFPEVLPPDSALMSSEGLHLSMASHDFELKSVSKKKKKSVSPTHGLYDTQIFQNKFQTFVFSVRQTMYQLL